jgi:hypothetical protein
MKNIEAYKERRETLKKLSTAVKALVKEGVYKTVNEALINEFYKKTDPEIKDFNTFSSWKEKGKTILKGSKAFVIWGQPRNIKQDEENDEFKFWPLCYLFSDNQVFEKGGE